MGFVSPYKEKQKLEFDPVTGSKNSSIKLSQECITLADKLVNEELKEGENIQTKKQYWLELAKKLESDKIPKQRISSTLKNIVEERLYIKLQDRGVPKSECKISGISHFYQTMKDNGYTNPNKANNIKSPIPRVTIIPKGIEFDWLKLHRELFTKSISAIDICIQKCTLDRTSIRSQIDKNRVKNTQGDHDELYQKTKLLVEKRIKNVQGELSHITQKDIEDIKSKIKQIIIIKKKLNDKTKLTLYEKEFVRILIERFAYDNGTIASILNIDTKHIKNNILRQKSNPHDQDSIFKQLDFLARCPGCGLGIADYIDEQYDNYKAGKSISGKFNLESFPLPPYADQVIEKNQIIRDLEIENTALKEQLKSK